MPLFGQVLTWEDNRYSYCRMADDLIDEPPEGLDTSVWISRLSSHLDLVYKPKEALTPRLQADRERAYIDSEFPASAKSALTLLPTSLLPPEPLYRLLEGFKTDSSFRPAGAGGDDAHAHAQTAAAAAHFPIADEGRLREYASQVAGTVGQLCLSLIAHHSSRHVDPARRGDITAAAGRMGIALQYVNIARDIAVDTTLGRVYLPTTWLAEEGLTPDVVVATISTRGEEGSAAAATTVSREKRDEVLARLVGLRRRLLDKAFAIYVEARPIMDWLPDESRRPMIVAVESYMEIGRVLLEKDELLVGEVSGRPRRATVPKLRRLRVALEALVYA